MRRYSIITCLFILFIIGCTGGDGSENEPVESDTLSEVDAAIDSSEMNQTITNVPSLWNVEEQPDHTDKLRQPADNKIAAFSPQELISALNESYPGIYLSFNKISHDTIYIAIPESNYLVDQVGNTGAYNYMATTVFNLTELNKIKYVNFNFKGGEHAAPGTYSRDDFKRLR